MKKLIFIILFALMTNINFANGGLTDKMLKLCVCAALEAQGDLKRLAPAINDALDAGVSVNELKEAFSQLYAYTGFPRSLNALGILNEVLKEREGLGVNDIQQGMPFKRPEIWDNAVQSLENGEKIQTLISGKPFNYEFSPQIDYYLKAHLFGDIFASNQLSIPDRELVTVAALSGMSGVEPQLAAHKLGAVNAGNASEDVEKLCKYLSDNGYSYIDGAAQATCGEWSKGEPNITYSKYFIGNSYLAPIAASNLKEGEEGVVQYANVTFEPGCRNNWHIHHGAHQILICVSGRGWYQEWGKEAVVLLPGMIIDIPAEVKHWHGAQKDSWFQHLTHHVQITDEVSNEWLEPVDDNQYPN